MRALRNFDEGVPGVNLDGSPNDEVYFMGAWVAVRRASALCSDNPPTCRAGIIDILQQYNAKKAAETFFKGLKFDREEISSVNPKKYAERFVRFIDNTFD